MGGESKVMINSEVPIEEIKIVSEISKSINSSGNSIADSIVGLEGTIELLLSASTVTSLLQMSLVAVVGALSAYIFNALHWKIVEKNKKISGVTLELRYLINDLESISVEYWTRDYKEEDHQDISVSEISIKSKIRLISRYIKLVTSELKTKNGDQNILKLEEFSLNIFDLVTGDDFESRERKSSKRKAQKILNECSDIRVTILSLDLCK